MQKTAGTILDEIVAARAERVRQARRSVPLEAVARTAASRTDFRSFSGSLSTGGLQVIAEMKRASPSAGLLRGQYDCRSIAQGYEAGGAAALSILTEEDYFQGSLTHLQEARGVVRLPVLRKDFIVDEYQVYESCAAGADALLLIVAALSRERLRNLLALSARLKVAALVEAHNEEELDGALDAGAELIGVNNRNLKTLEVNLETSLRLREKIPSGCVAVAESGIHSAEDLRNLAAAGFHAALVGEWFMRSSDPGRALAELLADARK
ncbi:MAG: indole-3-glycerol phosphate synthase TrpC [Terriglobia bacterium]